MQCSDRLEDVYRKAATLGYAGRRFAMALLLDAEGSTPRKAGVRAVIDAAGRIFGTLGGGAVEIESQRLAVLACESRRPAVLEFNLDDASACDPGPICGGRLRVLLDPTAAGDAPAYARAAEALVLRRKGVLLTTVRTASTTEVSVDWLDDGAIDPGEPFCAGAGADAVASCMARETPRLFGPTVEPSGASVELFVEPVIPAPRLLIVGGGHIGRALAPMADDVGFDVTVLDDRPEFTAPGVFAPGVTALCGDIGQEVARFPLADDTYVVIVTSGHTHDAAALARCVTSDAAYIGMIGSRRKVALIRESFLESHLAGEEQFDRVFAPVGLDIGAVTVPEIAASILAQLIAVRRTGRGGALSMSEGDR